MNDDFSQPANQLLTEQIHILIEEQPHYLQQEKLFKKLARTKYKEILREFLTEDRRKGNFIRVYPQMGCDIYDKYFQQPRPLNRYLYKMLYTEYLGLEQNL